MVYYFMIASVLFVTLVATFITEKVVIPNLDAPQDVDTVGPDGSRERPRVHVLGTAEAAQQWLTDRHESLPSTSVTH